MNHLAIEIHAWANEAFPARTDQSMFLKLYGEIAEMIDATDDKVGDEIADVLIMVLDYARRKGVNPSVAVQRKMKINRERSWKMNKLGAYSHVKDEQQPPQVEPLRVLEVPGPGSGDAVAGSQALAHDRDDAGADPCRAHGQCLAARGSDCHYVTRDVLPDRRYWVGCPRTRRVGIVDRGYPHPHEAVVGVRREISGGGSVTGDLFVLGEPGGERKAPNQAV